MHPRLFLLFPCMLATTVPVAAQTFPIAAPPPLTAHRDASGCWASAGPDQAASTHVAIGVDESGAYWLRTSGRDWQFADKAPVSIRVIAEDVLAPGYQSQRRDTTVEARGFLDSAGWHGVIFPLARPGYTWGQFSLFNADEPDPFVIIDNPRSRAAISLRSCLIDLARDDRGSGKPATTKPNPRGGVNVITDDDYPAAALRAEQQGRVAVALTVSAHGIISDCAVTETSGVAILDSTTCSLFLRRLRLDPALDEAGQPTQGVLKASINWRIPDSGPSPAPPGPLPAPIRQ